MFTLRTFPYWRIENNSELTRKVVKHRQREQLSLSGIQRSSKIHGPESSPYLVNVNSIGLEH